MMDWPDLERLLGAAAIVFAYALMCVAVFRRHRRGMRRHGNDEGAGALLAYASQTGCAAELAEEAAARLSAAGEIVALHTLDELTPERLAAFRSVWLIASTHGEGDAPDNGAAFANLLAAMAPDSLREVRYGLLALGDSGYAQFCGFGRFLDAQLRRCGAQALFAPIEADRLDPLALQRWDDALKAAGAGARQAAVSGGERYRAWVLQERSHLNPGSPGAPLYMLTLRPVDDEPLPEWEAGDLALVLPEGEENGAREYSIASIPADGVLQLLVRVVRREDGSPGRVSGWLTQTLAIGQQLRLRLRANTGFRIDVNSGRPLVLIGNGSGLAGLRSHLKARARDGRGPNWLLFGERDPERDRLCAEEIRAWAEQGVLAHADLAFSRAASGKAYVQDLLRAQAERLKSWVEQGAAIYVCGNLNGMAAGVDAALRDILGEPYLQEIRAQGRYRRDVY